MLEDKDEDKSVDDGEEGGVVEDHREEEEGERERGRRSHAVMRPTFCSSRCSHTRTHPHLNTLGSLHSGTGSYPARMHVSMYEPPHQRHPA